MTKTNLALPIGGACAFALLVFGVSVFAPRSASGARPDRPARLESLAWDQPPGIPPTGTGTRPKRLQQIVWDQPPGIPPTGSGARPKGTA